MKWNGTFFGRMVCRFFLLVLAVALFQNRNDARHLGFSFLTTPVAQAADSCDQTWTAETGMSGAPVRVVSFTAETCVRMNLGVNEDAVVGAGDFARIVLDNNGSVTVVHNTPHSLKALEGPGVYVGNNVSQGFAVIVNQARSICEFNRRYTNSGGASTFTGGQFPLTAWAGQSEQCGAIVADLDITFTREVYVTGQDGFADVVVRANRALQPGETAEIDVSTPAGPVHVLLTEQHQDSTIHTSATGSYLFTYNGHQQQTATVARINVAVSNPTPQVGQPVSFNVTSVPAALDVVIDFANGQTGEVVTPSVVQTTYGIVRRFTWIAYVFNHSARVEFARGNIDPVAAPVQPGCTPVPAQSTWSQQSNASGHLFVMTTSGNSLLRVCGQIPADVTLLVQGGTVETQTNALTYRAGPIQVDVTLSHGIVFGSRSCLAHAKAEQMVAAAQANGNPLDHIQLPPADQPCQNGEGQNLVFLPFVRVPAPVYNLPVPAVYNLHAPAGDPVSSQSTGDGKVYEIMGAIPTGFTFIAWGTVENTPSSIVGMRGQISIQLAGGAWAILRDADTQTFYAARKTQYNLADYAPPPWN